MAGDDLPQAFADFLVGTTYDGLPPTTIRAAKDLVLVSLDCSTGAGSPTPAQIVTQVFEEFQRVEESTVWDRVVLGP
jgi:hypothetical protein